MKRDNKIKVCRILAVVFLCFWTISGVRVLAQNATSILDKAASAYEDSNGLSAYFTMQTRSDVQKVSESFDGTIDIKGDKFACLCTGEYFPGKQFDTARVSAFSAKAQLIYSELC